MEDAVKADPALVTKILKLINSAYYYLPVEISSIRQALALLGINNLRKYLAVLLVLDASKTLNIPLNEYRKMLLAALIAEKLAKYLKVDSDIAFLGRIILLFRFGFSNASGTGSCGFKTIPPYS